MTNNNVGPDSQSVHINETRMNHSSVLNISTDQDALFEKILEKVPSQKRELLSTSWSKDYLNRLTSLPATALHNEPGRLREEQLKVERSMSELAFRDYKTFILVKDCKQDVQSTFETLGQHLDHFQDIIPKFIDTLTGFSDKVSPILEKQHIYSSVLATHSQLLEVLEIPLLMETCVRNGYYNEALELASHVQRLISRYPGIGIIQEIELKVAQGKEMMLIQLLAQLREPIKLPVALRTVGFLRRMGNFSSQNEVADDDEFQSGAAPATSKGRGTVPGSLYSTATMNSAVGVVEDETPLKMLFLKSRGLYMDQQLSKIVFHKGDSFGYLKKYIDVTRECLFDIMTYYKSIFGSADHLTNFSSLSSPSIDRKGSGTGPASGPGSIEAEHASHQKQHHWTTENLLADFVTYRTQIIFSILKLHIPQIHDTSALLSVLTQLMYFGANMAKIGFDLRYLVTSLFEEAVIRVVGGAFQRGADEFLDSLGGEGRNQPDWLLPSQWMVSGIGRTSASLSSASTPSILSRTSSADITLGSGPSSLSPQTYLMDYPALAYLTNSYLTALNSLRLLAPLSLAIPLREILVDSLTRVDFGLEKYDHHIFGERPSAFRSTLRPTSTSIPQNNSNAVGFKLQGAEESKVLSEQKILDEFLVVYKRAVQEYILKCFDEGIYGGLVQVESFETEPNLTTLSDEQEKPSSDNDDSTDSTAPTADTEIGAPANSEEAILGEDNNNEPDDIVQGPDAKESSQVASQASSDEVPPRESTELKS
ncbi:conserved oligomeric Golgi complex component [Lobosporangium transversale]|uniref:Conserved oligomeric Golgi complex subunit 8 n=1 Tax=Lobosporangium transversale TaxID=64571 RepID=A0A1Y2GJA7_9FUNG|nr:Dor1-like family-domain-containing protein [Lobosporangium transversale]KAF9914540.1 conserved oligomeric Golgi complex component [Lobosporangium transversale]ORZ11345.1 Dor1-like family-domain-containing protein [Lobosporangium transversale]|eukprot:XP_021879660.1 Dor1-like family-domain-containing protein [Lobosporangium transversale]